MNKKTTMNFEQQMNDLHDQPKNHDGYRIGTIRPNKVWTLSCFREFCYYIDLGYLWQDCGTDFVLNPDYDGDVRWREDEAED